MWRRSSTPISSPMRFVAAPATNTRPMPDTTAPTTESSEANVDAVVIGAGMTGLMAAWTLTRLGKRVCVLESKSRPGGLVATTHRDGFLLEHGPCTILAKSPAFRRLLEYASQDLEIVTADPRAKARR
ncbi:MAG TPA: NAD(P)/FAD-dependent oxidoreductase, partial [Planctomycetaceae bacterium]|nr:NAD(P)/FAD-dependent oxidoreductase [Planctomycetaceae bacterium]